MAPQSAYSFMSVWGRPFLKLDSTTADYWVHVSAIRDFATSLTAPGPLYMVGEKNVSLLAVSLSLGRVGSAEAD